VRTNEFIRETTVNRISTLLLNVYWGYNSILRQKNSRPTTSI